MTEGTPIDLMFAVQFDYSLYVAPELLGAQREIALGRDWRGLSSAGSRSQGIQTHASPSKNPKHTRA